MVARLCRLRLTLLLAAFRGSPLRVLRTVLWGLLAAVGAVALAWAPRLLAPDAIGREAIDTVLFALVLLAATAVPFFANRRHLEPRQFGQYPARPAEIGAALLVSTLVSWPVLWLLLWLVALVTLRPEWREQVRAEWWALLVATLLTVLIAVCGARVASALSKLAVPPQSRGLIRAIGALLLVVLLPVAVFAIAETIRAPGGADTSDAAATLSWLPFGAPLAGLIHATSGETGEALAHFGVAFGWALLLLAVWFPIVARSLHRVERPADPLLARRSMGWFDRFSAKPASVIGARSLTYWGRDSRYRVALLAAPIGATLSVLALWVAGVDPVLIALVPLPFLLLFLGWSLHNDIATDSTAIWMHIASGTRGVQDRAGRLIPVLVIGVPLLLVGSSLTVTVIGDWRVLPSVLGLNAAVLFVACGVSSVYSAMMPYPTTRPGESPFAQPAVAGSGAGVAQTSSLLITLLLALPPVWLAVETTLSPTLGSEMLALFGGIAYGLIVLVLGIVIGGAFFNRIGPDYVALTQTFD